MSEVQNRPATFFDLYRKGALPESAIGDFIDAWHKSGAEEQRPLHEFLGMSFDEYGVWVMDPEALPLILAARRGIEPLSGAIHRRVEAMKAIGSPMNRGRISALAAWLQAHRPADRGP